MITPVLWSVWFEDAQDAQAIILPAINEADAKFGASLLAWMATGKMLYPTRAEPTKKGEFTSCLR